MSDSDRARVIEEGAAVLHLGPSGPLNPEPEMSRNELGGLLRQVLQKQDEILANQAATDERLKEGDARFQRIEDNIAALQKQVGYLKGHVGACLHGVQAMLKERAVRAQVEEALAAVNQAVVEIEQVEPLLHDETTRPDNPAPPRDTRRCPAPDGCEETE